MEDYTNWRMKRVPFLEKVIKVNLSTISFIMKEVRRNSINIVLKQSFTVYLSWGKGRFGSKGCVSKTNNQQDT